MIHFKKSNPKKVITILYQERHLHAYQSKCILRHVSFLYIIRGNYALSHGGMPASNLILERHGHQEYGDCPEVLHSNECG